MPIMSIVRDEVSYLV